MRSASARTRPPSGASPARPDRRSRTRAALAGAALLALAGCATAPRIADEGADPAGACADLFARLDHVVASADVRDARAARIEGFPWLRATRPLASLSEATESPARFDAWVGRLAAVDRRARRAEIGNLPADRRAALQRAWAPAASRHDLPHSVRDATRRCRDLLRARALDDPGERDALRAAVEVPDAYNTWQRVLGLYPLAWRVARPRVEAFQAERDAAFRASPPAGPKVRRYAVDADPPADPAALAQGIERDALGIPDPTPRERATLFAAHAPAWAVVTRSDADRPGALLLDADGRPRVDSARPVEYRRLGWTRFRGRIALQLSYLVWFPERPAEGWLDLYAGHLDGVIWRVTLGADGRPVAYDSIHPCGCYYTLLPAAGWDVATVPDDQEPVSTPARAPAFAPDRRVVVGLAARTHYLVGVGAEARPLDARPMAPMAWQRLRSLPHPGGGNASAYAESGLIPSSARGERFYFWPLGVPSAGAMRQWGSHAIAFVGRRHFDDPFLLDRLLEEASP